MKNKSESLEALYKLAQDGSIILCFYAHEEGEDKNLIKVRLLDFDESGNPIDK